MEGESKNGKRKNMKRNWQDVYGEGQWIYVNRLQTFYRFVITVIKKTTDNEIIYTSLIKSETNLQETEHDKLEFNQKFKFEPDI